MTHATKSLPQIIYVDKEKCVNCHACIAVCPVKICNDGSGAYVNLNPDTCIGCGRCLSACTHGARSFADDLASFLRGVSDRQKMVAIAAPSVVSNFPDEYLRLNGWLKGLGVDAIFDVSFGAELCAKSYAAHIRRRSPQVVIAQPCPAIVTYVQTQMPGRGLRRVSHQAGRPKPPPTSAGPVTRPRPRRLRRVPPPETALSTQPFSAA